MPSPLLEPLRPRGGAHPARTGPVAVAAALVAVLVCLTLTVPALAAPSPDDIRRQREKAATLGGQAEEQGRTVAKAQARLEARAARAAKALEAYHASTEASTRAQRTALQARQRLADARTRARDTRERLGRYAASLYRATGGSTQLANLTSLLDSGSPTEFTRRLGTVQWVGDQEGMLLDRQRTARAARREATTQAQVTVRRAHAAERAQRSAKRRADTLVADQRRLLAAQRAKLEQARGDADAARHRAEQMAHARKVAERRRKAAARRRAEALAAGEPVLGAGGCTGGDVSGYSNGQIPTSMLCPLWGAPGHLLTAPAAAAFNALSKEYAADHGSPICVTDSYRSYAIQVQLYEEKPDLAAVPGTSNHGWARAVDLCGGIESFGTSEYAWMLAHAPAYGWYHPSWARQGGGREEPWHWEYGG